MSGQKTENETEYKKTKNMIFNFTKKHQFTTNLNVDEENIEIVNEAKLLGTIITDKLTWDRNVEELTDFHQKCAGAIGCGMAQQPNE